MPRAQELLPEPNCELAPCSSLATRLAELAAQGCLVNRMKWLPSGYELRFIQPEVARRYRGWNDNLGTGQDRSDVDTETRGHTPNTREIHQPELGV